MAAMKYITALEQTRKLLHNTTNPHLEAQLLVSHILDVSRSVLIAYPERQMRPEEWLQIERLGRRRAAGEPSAYLLQAKEFWTLSLKVTPDTLIPRPETELLVELILRILPENKRQTIADLGTGSGAVALAIATERPHWQLTATDQSPATLQVAKENAARLTLSNVAFFCGSWCAALPQRGYHAIVSNPPYIAQNDAHLLSGDLRFEPEAALVAGAEGLDAIGRIISESPEWLLPRGYLLLEHGYNQGAAVRQLMREGGFSKVATHRDLASLDRVTMGFCSN